MLSNSTVIESPAKGIEFIVTLKKHGAIPPVLLGPKVSHNVDKDESITERDKHLVSGTDLNV